MRLIIWLYQREGRIIKEDNVVKLLANQLKTNFSSD